MVKRGTPAFFGRIQKRCHETPKMVKSDTGPGGRAQPVPAAKGAASPRRQRVGAHDVPSEGAQGHGVALQLEASHREAGRGHGALAVGGHQ